MYFIKLLNIFLVKYKYSSINKSIFHIITAMENINI